MRYEQEALKILKDDNLKSSEKLEQIALYHPVCQHMAKMKKRFFWKLVLEDVCVLLLRENLELQNMILTEKLTTVKIPMMGVVK